MSDPNNKPAKVDTNSMGSMGLIVFTVLEFIIFALTVIATPVAQFVPKHREHTSCVANYCTTYKNLACITLWGQKPKCSSTKYYARGMNAWGCGRRKNNMVGAEVFAIVSIVVTLIILIMAVVTFLGMMNLRLISAIVSIIAVGTLLVTWACVAGVYNQKFCNSTWRFKMSQTWDYGAGFVLFVIAWCLQVINCILMFVLLFI